jgi:hypothetical protein
MLAGIFMMPTFLLTTAKNYDTREKIKITKYSPHHLYRAELRGKSNRLSLYGVTLAASNLNLFPS